MLVPSFALLLPVLSAVQSATAALTESNLKKHVDTLALDFSFGPVKEAYWTGYPHHRRTPFAVSPDGTKAYVAYLDSSETDVHVQQVDPSTFAATGTTVTVSGAKEAGGLVAHDDGFAVLVNEAMPSGTTNAPPSNTPVAVLYRYTSGKQSWKTWLGGPNVHASDGMSASPDMNGDLVYSSKAGLYGAYFVVTDYSGDASGHYGDSIQYVKEDGTLTTISGASSSWGCSHNTGIAFEAADAAPFASICAEDQGAIWLNTKTQGMTSDGVKISNENTTNGGGGESLGGMSGSFSGLARFGDSSKYVFTWVSRGAKMLSENSWMGSGYTNALNRTNQRNVAVAILSDKQTLVGDQASSTVGQEGDSQVNWVTSGANDCSNAHAAAFGTSNALLTWEEISDPVCDFIAMGCRGTFAGTFFQQVDSTGAKVGEAFSVKDTFVAGDMVTMSDGRICWPYVSMTWDLSQAVGYGGSTDTTKKMSFACMSLDGTTTTSTESTSSSSAGASSAASQVPSSTSAPAATSAAAPVEESSSAPVATSAPATTATPTTLLTQTRSSTPAVQVDSTAAVSSAVPTASSGVDGSNSGASASEVPAVSTPAAGFPSGGAAFTPGAWPTAWPTAWPSGWPSRGNEGFQGGETEVSSSSDADGTQGSDSSEQEGPCAVEYVWV